MILYPAIDIREGKAVRLTRGDYAQETVYDQDPAEAAKRWVADGARYLHVFVPCPLGWGAASKDTIRLARLAKETGLFPVFEAEHGEVVSVSKIASMLEKATEREHPRLPAAAGSSGGRFARDPAEYSGRGHSKGSVQLTLIPGGVTDQGDPQ